MALQPCSEDRCGGRRECCGAATDSSRWASALEMEVDTLADHRGRLTTAERYAYPPPTCCDVCGSPREWTWLQRRTVDELEDWWSPDQVKPCINHRHAAGSRLQTVPESLREHLLRMSRHGRPGS